MYDHRLGVSTWFIIVLLTIAILFILHQWGSAICLNLNKVIHQWDSN